MALHRFSASRYFREEQFDAIADPTTGLLPRLLAVVEGGRSNLVMCPTAQPRPADVALQTLVQNNELKNLLGQLVLGPRGKVEAFYAFSRVSIALDEQAAYLVELLVPHVHSAFLRVLAVAISTTSWPMAVETDEECPWLC